MKNLCTLFFLICFSSIHSVYAKDVPLKTCEQVALNFYFEHVNLHKKMDRNQIELSQTIPISYEGELVFYVININNGQGYVIVSSDDATTPVLSYSFSGTFKSDENLPPAYADWLNSYKKQLSYIKKNNISSNLHSEKWELYKQSEFYPSKDLMSVSPLLGNISWGQGAYYNADCPYDVSAGSSHDYHCPVGCVATAMCQIMKYWEYPSSGTGSNSYSSSYGTLSANFGSSSYNWSSMPNYITNYNTEVAKICYHVGVSVNMEYSSGGSAAGMGGAATALNSNFNYASTTIQMGRMYYSDIEWKGFMKADLDNGMPIMYNGMSSNLVYSHAFVCDGYEGSDYFHFNWGWDGNYNSYNYIDDLYASSMDFSYHQGGVFGITPFEALSANFSADIETVSVGETVNFTNESLGDYTSLTWSFPGGTPSSSTEQNPTVTYNTLGTYNVQLTISDGTDNDIEIKAGYITVINVSLVNFTLDFESSSDFDSDFSPWTTLDVDGEQYEDFTYSFPGVGDPSAFIAYNPSQTTPNSSGVEALQPHGGERFGACFSNAIDWFAELNDWLISPKVQLGTGSEFSLWVKSYSSGELMRYKIGISTTNNNPESFTYISSGEFEEAPTEWTKKIYDISAYDGQEVYVAVNCVPYGGTLFMIDDLVINSLTSDKYITPKEIKVYPNPTTGIIHVTNIENAQISVFNILGELVFTSSNENIINLSELPCGNYIVKIQNEKENLMRKIILTK